MCNEASGSFSSAQKLLWRETCTRTHFRLPPSTYTELILSFQQPTASSICFKVALFTHTDTRAHTHTHPHTRRGTHTQTHAHSRTHAVGCEKSHKSCVAINDRSIASWIIKNRGRWGRECGGVRVVLVGAWKQWRTPSYFHSHFVSHFYVYGSVMPELCITLFPAFNVAAPHFRLPSGHLLLFLFFSLSPQKLRI